ncbi:tetratricopeptide repeat protein [Candidatus Sumerlaeota bacterium]|nr:tetratricopeptide repeat protein [Candidatus Sumerlaeota bacterium]
MQLAAFETAAEAEQAAEDFRELGLSPVHTLQIDSWHKVLFGIFSYRADATLHSHAIRSAGIAESFVVSLDVLPFSDRPSSSAEISSPLPPIFTLEVASARDLPISDLHGNPTYEELERIDREESDERYRQELLAVLDQVEDDDPITGYALVNLAILDIASGERDAALARLLPVANGEVASAASHRVMAMRRVAWLLHNHSVDRLRAYQAYTELERFTCSESLRGICVRDRAGLLMELALSNIGTLEECRDLCELGLAAVAPDQTQTRAVLRLIAMETLAHQMRHSEALDEATALAADLEGDPQVEREWWMSRIWIGRCAADLGDWALARETARSILDEAPEDAPQFAGFPVRAEAMYLLGLSLGCEGDREASRQILEHLIENHGDTQSARQAREALQSLERNWSLDEN